jgi:tetratricopeptide (TPR) repeat protein
LIVAAIIIAVTIDLVGVSAMKARKRSHASLVLPAVPQLQELRELASEDSTNRDLHLALAQSYLYFHHYMSARAEFDRALALGADEWSVRTGRIEANRALQRTDLIETDLTRIIEMRPKLIGGYIALAENRAAAGDMKGAKQALDMIPRSPDGLPEFAQPNQDRLTTSELLATAYSQVECLEGSRELIESNLKVEPSRISSRIMLGKYLHATGHKVEAIPYLFDGVKSAPKVAELQYLLGTCFKARGGPGDLDRAFACFQRAIIDDKQHGGATLEIARECDRRGLKKDAAYAYLQAYKLGMEGASPLLRSGQLLLEIGNREEGWFRIGMYFEATHKGEQALAEYRNLTLLHSCCRSGYIHLARVYGLMSQPAKSLEYLYKAQQLEPKRASELVWNIIDELGEARDDEGRLRSLKAIVNKGGKEADEARYQLSNLADRAGNTQEAVRWMTLCTVSQPKDAVFQRELGRLLLQLRGDRSKLAEATRHLESAVRLAPDDREAYFNLGRAYSYGGINDDAVLALRHSVDLGPEIGEGYQALGQALSRVGLKDEARDVEAAFGRFELFEQTRDTLEARCKRNPIDALAQRRMGEFHMRAHEYAAAAQRFRKCLAIKPSDKQARAQLAEACGYLGKRQEQREQLDILNGREVTL